MAKWIFLACVVIGVALIVAGLWPYFEGLMAQREAERLGCIVNAATINPCIVNGVDIGPRLARSFNAPFMVLFTFVWAILGSVLVLIGLSGGLVSLLVGRRKRA